MTLQSYNAQKIKDIVLNKNFKKIKDIKNKNEYKHFFFFEF